MGMPNSYLVSLLYRNNNKIRLLGKRKRGENRPSMHERNVQPKQRDWLPVRLPVPEISSSVRNHRVRTRNQFREHHQQGQGKHKVHLE